MQKEQIFGDHYDMVIETPMGEVLVSFWGPQAKALRESSNAFKEEVKRQFCKQWGRRPDEGPFQFTTSPIW